MEKLRIAILYGSYRHNRKGIRLAEYLKSQLTDRLIQVEFLDAMEFNLPFLDKMYKEYPKGEAPENIEELHQKLEASDAYILVSGEYNHGLIPGLKNLLDHFQKEFFYKPAGIAAYSAGSFAGVRSAVHLRAVLGELGMVSIPTIFTISRIGKTFDENGVAQENAINDRFERFFGELEWYSLALKKARNAGIPN